MNFHFLPQEVIRSYYKKCFKNRFEAAVLSIDITGFTAMCEAFLLQGRKGSEALALKIEFLFAPFVMAVESSGGYIADYAGDASFAIFPITNKITASNAVYFAKCTTRKYFKWLSKNRIHSISSDVFEISARAGIGFGNVELRIIEIASGKDVVRYKKNKLGYFFSGDAIEQSILALASARPNHMNISSIHLKPEKCISPILQTHPRETSSLFKKFLPAQIIDRTSFEEIRLIYAVYGKLPSEIDDFQLEKTFTIAAWCENEFGGYFSGLHFDHNGWGFLMIFGAPEAHEDDLNRAIEFSLFALRHLHFEQKIEIKIGINCGEAFAGLTGGAGRVKYTCLGDTVNLAERLSRLAQPCQIFCSEPVYQKAKKYNFVDVGKHAVKGKQELINAFQLIQKKTSAHGIPYEGEFCGREEELFELLKFTDPIFEKKFGRVVRIIGDAGTGKSRLLYELQKKLEQTGKIFQWLYLPCDPISKNPFNPVLYMLQSRFPYSEFEERESWKIRFQSAFEDFTENPKISDENRNELLRSVSILGGFLGYSWENSLYNILDAKGRKENFLYAAKALIKANAEIAPTIVVIEDIHWLDAETEQWLEILTRNVAGVPFIMITTERPDANGAIRELKLGNNYNPERVIMENLTSEGLKELVTSKFRAAPEPKLFDYLLSSTNCNPFFAEQFCHHLLETNSVKEIDNKMILIAPPELLPFDAEAMLIARIDSLGIKVKEMLQRASILGVRFAIRLLEGMSAAKTDLPEVISKAEQNGIVYAEEVLKFSEMYYLFHHILLQETAYGMQLPGVRAKLHKLALDLYEKLYSEEIRKTHYDDMARHAEKCGEIEKAIELLKNAAKYAEEKYQNQRALEICDKLLSLLRDDQIEDRIGIFLQESQILKLIGRNSESENACDRGLELAKKIQNTELIGYFYLQLGKLFMVKGNNNEAKDFIETSFKYFAELDDKNGMLKVLSQMATYYQFQGDYDQALELLEKHALICAELMDNKMLITNQYQRAMIYYWQGDFNKSGEYYLKAMKITEQINDIYQKACILHNVGLIHREQFNCDKAMEYFKASQKIFEDTGDKNGLSLFFGSVGGIYFQHEDCRTAIEFYKKELAIGIELGEKYLQYCALGDIGRAQIFQGNFSDGIKNLSKALEICEETGDKLGISINQNSLGEANMEIGNLMKAEYCFDSAILLGNELKMNSFLPLYLYNKALLYFEMARYNEASLLNIETLKSACIPQHKRTIFGANILNSKLLFISGKKEEAIEKLKELLGKSTDPYETGILNSQLWKFLKQVEDIKESGQIRIDIENHQKIALEIFTELHAKTMGYEYKKRINEMVKI